MFCTPSRAYSKSGKACASKHLLIWMFARRTKSEVAQTERLKWLLSAVVGLAIGVIASCVDWLIDSLSSFKFDSVEVRSRL